MSPVTSGKPLDLKRRAALVVDENHHTRKLVVDMCRAIDFGTVHSVRSTEAATAHLNEHTYDVVLCDWGLSKPGGPEFVQATRANTDRRRQRLPIVLMKVMPAQLDVAAAQAAGATKLLARPFSAQALIDTMKQIFRE